MVLEKISLKNFRSFSDSRFVLNHGLNVICGSNSIGKTNLLEAVYFLTNGQGFREEKEEELVRFEENEAVVTGLFNDSGNEITLEIRIKKETSSEKKYYFVNKTVKRRSFYIRETGSSVLFAPDQISLIRGSPSLRREYFNRTITATDDDYRSKLLNYEMALRRRNKILEKYKDEKTLDEELSFWNDYLIRESSYLTKKRQDYVDFLNLRPKLDSRSFSIEYLRNDFTADRLAKVFEKEKIIRRTLVGPQKDDFKITIYDKNKGKNVHLYASRSEERLAVFWLKINEVKYLEEIGRKPILLLDDIFSELDDHNKKIIMSLIRRYQTIITTTETDGFLKDSKETIIRL